MARLVLLSTYELGMQPLGCAHPAELLRADHEIRMRDLAVEAWSDDDILWADAALISVPMHTALRLALSCLERIRVLKPAIPVAMHGLYAPVAHATGMFNERDLIVAGESDPHLLEWVSRDQSEPSQGQGPAIHVELGPPRRSTGAIRSRPFREGLPPLDAYARLLVGDEERIVGGVEATRGCNHTCLHCPVPAIYGGRSRTVDPQSVLYDIDQLVDAGAEHIHFGDPDFLNRPAHARRIAALLHERYPDLTFDATVKVSHILDHVELWAEFKDAGLLFVISAFESTSDTVLTRLDKGHTSADLPKAVSILRGAGIEPRPSLLPFTPWTTRSDVIELFDFVARNDLIFNIDPVQFAIRLLLPTGSLLLAERDVELVRSLRPSAPSELGQSWVASDPLLDSLCDVLSARSEQAASSCAPIDETYRDLRRLVFDCFDQDDPGVPDPNVPLGPPGNLRPRLSETWFCCSEPTAQQRALIEQTP